jgi:hypothetical protein
MANPTSSKTLKKSDVIKVTGIPLQRFQHWLDRRVIRLSGEDIPAGGQGKPRGFSQRRTYEIAIAHRISLLGIPAAIAVALASKLNEPQCGRPIGGLFPRGRTILLSTADGTGTIRNVQPDGDIDSLLNAESAIIVDIGAIVSNVNLRLTTTL